MEVVSSAELADLVNAKNAGDTVTVQWRTADGQLREGQAVLQEAVVN